jgi:carboxyl-terminal processing protease
MATLLPVRAQGVDLFEEVQRTLEQKGVTYDHVAARQAATLALVKQADPLGDVFDDPAYKQLLKRFSGTYYNAGMRLIHTNGLCYVDYLDAGSPAVAAGVKKGSYLLEVDEQDVTETRLTEAIRITRSPKAKSIALKLMDKDDQTYTTTVDLEALPVRAVELKEEFPKEIGYLKMNGLYKNSATTVVNYVARLNGLKRLGLILDLRDANGRDLHTVKLIAELFAEKDLTLFTLANRGDQGGQVFTSEQQQDLSLPAMVLVNKQTTGAAELLAAVLQASGRGAMVLGEHTPGDFALRDFSALADGHQLYVVGKTITLSSGQVLDGSVGLLPDILVADADLPTPEKSTRFRSARKNTKEEDALNESLQIRVQNDAVLQRAVDVLLGLKALNFRALDAAE